MVFGCRMGWGRQVNAGGIFFRCQLGKSCPQKKVMNSPAGTKGTVDAPYNFLTHTCARINRYGKYRLRPSGLYWQY